MNCFLQGRAVLARAGQPATGEWDEKSRQLAWQRAGDKVAAPTPAAAGAKGAGCGVPNRRCKGGHFSVRRVSCWRSARAAGAA